MYDIVKHARSSASLKNALAKVSRLSDQRKYAEASDNAVTHNILTYYYNKYPDAESLPDDAFPRMNFKYTSSSDSDSDSDSSSCSSYDSDSSSASSSSSSSSSSCGDEKYKPKRKRTSSKKNASGSKAKPKKKSASKARGSRGNEEEMNDHAIAEQYDQAIARIAELQTKAGREFDRMLFIDDISESERERARNKYIDDAVHRDPEFRALITLPPALVKQHRKRR